MKMGIKEMHNAKMINLLLIVRNILIFNPSESPVRTAQPGGEL